MSAPSEITIIAARVRCRRWNIGADAKMRVVDRCAAGRPLVVELSRQPRRRRRPRHQDARQMVERADERLIAGSSRSAMKRSSAPRASTIGCAAHAVADVEQHADADRRPLVGKLRDGLRIAVLEYLEVVFR